MRIHKDGSLLVHLRPFQAGTDAYMAVSAWVACAGHPEASVLLDGELLAHLRHQPLPVPLDPGLPKLRGEWFACGHAHAPRGTQVRRIQVRVQAGSADKTLLVSGARSWMPGDTPDAPPPEPSLFSSLPLTWRYAFGGSGFAANPSGTGYAPGTHPDPGRAPSTSDRPCPLPQIEDPARVIQGRGDIPVPAGFLPLPTPLSGAGEAWRMSLSSESTARLPADLDWTVFNRASPDQQRDGFWSGRETCLVEGMHPDRLSMGLSPPPLRVRGFLVRCGQGEELSVELALRLDTIWLFPDDPLVLAIWRGVFEVSRPDAPEIAELHLLTESLDTPPRPHEHYLEDRATRPPTSHAFALDTEPLQAALCGYPVGHPPAGLYCDSLHPPSGRTPPPDAPDPAEEAIRAAYARDMEMRGIDPGAVLPATRGGGCPDASLLVDMLRAQGFRTPSTESLLLRQEMQARIAEERMAALLAAMKPF